jgi:hypothetical protein
MLPDLIRADSNSQEAEGYSEAYFQARTDLYPYTGFEAQRGDFVTKQIAFVKQLMNSMGYRVEAGVTFSETPPLPGNRPCTCAWTADAWVSSEA